MMGVSVIPCYTWAFKVSPGPTLSVGRIAHQEIQQPGAPAPLPNIASPVLQKLHQLDGSSSGFHDELSSIFYGEEYRRCAEDLQGDDLLWLVGYLDKVRYHFTLPCSPPELL